MEAVCLDFEAVMQAWEADDDHVHLLIAYPPKVALSKPVNALKGASSYRLRGVCYPEVQAVLRGQAFWSPGCCVVSCGGAPLGTIKTYVETQRDPQRARKGQKARAAAKTARNTTQKNALTPP
jgi:putative transposase